MHVFYSLVFVHVDANLRMFHRERRSRNTIITMIKEKDDCDDDDNNNNNMKDVSYSTVSFKRLI